MTHMVDPARRAVVTGGASGLGLAIATRLHASGAKVALIDRDGAGATAAAAALGERCIAIEADVRDPRGVGDAVARAATTFGGLDTVVVSAGVLHFKPLAEVTEADWDMTLDVNLKGAFLVCQAAAPLLIGSGRGRIVTIASDAGRRGAPFIQAYAASKFGLVGLTESLAAELASSGTTANCICPAACPTTAMGTWALDWKSRASSTTTSDVAAATAKANPVGRNATEADVAAAAMFFISDDAAFLTGVALDVDGGLHLDALNGMR
jgi:NAD(P)-dependent dehydrogenase (short-subunit alcohol dehydrogenase family)